MLDTIIDYIVLIAAVCVALTNISKFIKKPVDAVKSHVDADQQKRDDELTQSITESVMDQVEPLIAEIKDINLAQNEAIQLLTNGQLDLLRQQILYLYNHHKASQSLSADEMEQLIKLYNDYKTEGGNSFVDRLYQEMCQWSIQG